MAPIPSSRRVICLCLVCGMMASRGFGEDAPAPATPEKLVELLEKGDFDERQNAVRQLQALGEKARKALETAAERSDILEVRETSQRLLNGLSSASVRIEVFDRKGRPIVDAELEATLQPQSPLAVLCQSLEEPDETKPLQLRSDAAGKIVLERVSPGPVSLGFNWKHLQVASAAQAISAAYLRPGENRLQYVLQRGGTVSGRALAAADDKPLAGVAVALVPDSGQDALRLDPDKTCLNPENSTGELRAATDAAGAFTIERVPPGSFLLFAQHPDHVTACGGTVRVGDEMRVTAAPLKLTARAAAWGGIKALLLNDKGEPLKDAKLLATVTRLAKGPDAAAERAAMKALLSYAVHDSQQHEGPRECSTDGTGHVELKDLRPGTYRVVLRLADDNDDKMRKYLLDEAAVAAGKVTPAAGRKPAALGSITGRIAWAAGAKSRDLNVWALPMDDPEALVVAGELKAHALWFQNWNDDPDCCVSAENDGKFELKRLLPGRYTLAAWRDSELAGLIHGVEVTAGKAAKAPDLALPAEQRRQTDIDVSGAVFLSDGQPAEGAKVTIIFETGGTTETRCSDKGLFSYQGTNECGPVLRLVAHLPGYRPVHVDLTAPGATSRGLALRLQKQQYGGAAVTVRDTEGKPLKGAAVTAGRAATAGAGAAGLSFGLTGTRTGLTDKAGRAVLKGLAAGKRQFGAARDGYYLEKPVEAEVVADTVTPVAITLRRGLTLQGIVEAPEGADRSKVLVQLFCESTDTSIGSCYQYCALTAVADAKGEFEFSGLPPGRVRLSVQSPGLVAAEDSNAIALTDKTAPVRLKLVPEGGLSVDLGREFRGMGLYLSAPGSWDPARPAKAARASPPGEVRWAPAPVGPVLPQYCYPEITADSDGHAEAQGLRPQVYDLLLIPRDEWFREQDRTNCAVSRVIPGVRVSALPADISKLEPLQAQPPVGRVDNSTHPAGGRVTGRVVLKGATDGFSDERSLGWIRLAVVGDSAIGNCTFALPDALDPKRVPVVIGKAPEGFRLEGPGEFTVSGLPGGAGEYRVYLAYPSYEKQRGAWDTQWVIIGGAPVRVFRVADGQTVQLGDIPLELPPDLRDKMRQQRREQNEWLTQQSFGSDIGEDAEPAFQP